MANLFTRSTERSLGLNPRLCQRGPRRDFGGNTLAVLREGVGVGAVVEAGTAARVEDLAKEGLCARRRSAATPQRSANPGLAPRAVAECALRWVQGLPTCIAHVVATSL